MVGDAERCKAASDLLLRRHDIYIQPINYPTVAIGAERLRITPTPRHSEADVSNLVEALVDVWKTLELPLRTGQILPLVRRRQSTLDCAYPEMRRRPSSYARQLSGVDGSTGLTSGLVSSFASCRLA